MGILQDLNVLSVMAELTGRGLKLEQIDRALEKTVGPDWKGLRVIDWHKRLQEKGLLVHDEHATFLDDLEALVSGRTMLDEMDKRDRKPGGS